MGDYWGDFQTYQKGKSQYIEWGLSGLVLHPCVCVGNLN